MAKCEWNEEKSLYNVLKHGVSFDEAETVFVNALAVTFPDLEHSVGEERWVTFGHSDRQRLLVVVHSSRGANIRLISAHKANRAERRIYEQG